MGKDFISWIDFYSFSTVYFVDFKDDYRDSKKEEADICKLVGAFKNQIGYNVKTEIKTDSKIQNEINLSKSITPKKANQVITSLSIVTYNLENKTAKYEDFKNENWGVKFSNHILMDNDDQLLLLGTNITKKAKDSELVFITIKK